MSDREADFGILLIGAKGIIRKGDSPTDDQETVPSGLSEKVGITPQASAASASATDERR